MQSFIIDDLVGGFGSRHEARASLDEILRDEVTPLTAEEKRALQIEELDRTWGMTPEAIASQDDSFWDS